MEEKQVPEKTEKPQPTHKTVVLRELPTQEVRELFNEKENIVYHFVTELEVLQSLVDNQTHQ